MLLGTGMLAGKACTPVTQRGKAKNVIFFGFEKIKTKNPCLHSDSMLSLTVIILLYNQIIHP